MDKIEKPEKKVILARLNKTLCYHYEHKNIKQTAGLFYDLHNLFDNYNDLWEKYHNAELKRVLEGLKVKLPENMSPPKYSIGITARMASKSTQLFNQRIDDAISKIK